MGFEPLIADGAGEKSNEKPKIKAIKGMRQALKFIRNCFAKRQQQQEQKHHKLLNENQQIDAVFIRNNLLQVGNQVKQPISVVDWNDDDNVSALSSLGYCTDEECENFENECLEARNSSENINSDRQPPSPL